MSDESAEPQDAMSGEPQEDVAAPAPSETAPDENIDYPTPTMEFFAGSHPDPDEDYPRPSMEYIKRDAGHAGQREEDDYPRARMEKISEQEHREGANWVTEMGSGEEPAA